MMNVENTATHVALPSFPKYDDRVLLRRSSACQVKSCSREVVLNETLAACVIGIFSIWY